MSSADSSATASTADTSVSADATCPACAKPLPTGAVRCPNCGVALGEHQRCPHCHSIAPVTASEDARFVCSICGGVRIPIDDPAVVRSPEQIELLKSATAARSGRTFWLFIARVVAPFGGFSALVLALTLSVAHPPTLGAVVAALAVLVPFAFAGFAWKNSREHAARLAPALDAAWAAAARDVARTRGGELDAASFAKITGLSERDADQLLARMSAESQLASSVTAEGNLKYTLLDASSEAPKPLPAAR